MKAIPCEWLFLCPQLHVMHKSILFLLLFAITPAVFAGGAFKLKLKVELVNHESVSDTKVRVMNNGAEKQALVLPEDGDIRIELTEGKLYDVWIEKPGYLSHVIHNVHNEGSGKFKVTLYKATKKLKPGPDYAGVNRQFDDVKKMTIPAELLEDSVRIVKEDAMTKEQQVGLKTVQKVAKSQNKAQKKIDKLMKKRTKLEEDRNDVTANMASGETSKTDGEAETLKIQEGIVKVQKKLDKLAY